MSKVDFIIKQFNKISEDPYPEYPYQKFINRLFNNDMVRFFTWANSKGRFEDLDPELIEDEFYGDYLKFLYNTSIDEFHEEVLNHNDVKNGSDGFYIEIYDREDLLPLYCDNYRDFSEQDAAKRVFSEDFVDYAYYFNEGSVHQYVVDDLNENNLKSLKERILKELGNEQIEPETSLLEDIAEEQGQDFVTLNLEVLSRILSDEKSTDKILSGTYIESDLWGLYNQSSNYAYEEETTQEVMGGLKEYFDSWNWETVTKGEKDYEVFKLKVSDLDGDILKMLDNGEDIRDYSNYISILERLISEGDRQCISFRIPEYPDYTLLKKNINELFGDYV
jgi:hypothetical protein